LALKIFLYILPTVLMIMSKIEGYIALSTLERKTAAKYYYFMLVNVFLGSIITGTAFEQLHAFLHQSPTQYVFLLIFFSSCFRCLHDHVTDFYDFYC
jgi:hypothetical protein